MKEAISKLKKHNKPIREIAKGNLKHLSKMVEAVLWHGKTKAERPINKQLLKAKVFWYL